MARIKDREKIKNVVSFRLDKKDLKKLKSLSRRKGLTKSQCIRILINNAAKLFDDFEKNEKNSY